ncbi:MAG: hypothetical protein ACYTGS_15765 [Planctomycetota bacterium]
MSYAEQQAKRKNADEMVGRFDFSWEEKRIPLLHDGFLEPCKGNPSKSTLFISFWFANGRYRARIQDRGTDEKAFVDVDTLEHAFEVIEKALNDCTLDWTPDSWQRNGRNGS